MKQNVYVGLLDTCESRSEAEAESTPAYADSAITNRYDGIANRLITSLDIRECTDGAEGFRINKALWDTGASSSCISERMARKLGLRPVDTGVGISTTGKQDITYYIVDIVLTPEMVFKNVKIAGFPLQNHDVDFVIGMDIISKGTLLVKNNSGKTVVTFTV